MAFKLCSGRKSTYFHDTDSWNEAPVVMKLATQPFSTGGMRQAFQARLLLDDGSEVEAVVKRVKPELGLPAEAAKGEATCQLLAARIADQFNSLCQQKGLPHEVRMAPVALLQLEGSSELLTLEPFLEGPYRKQSDNMGNVTPDADELAVAFSYFSYLNSGGSLVVCDIQGVGNDYTDPQIHTLEPSNLGLGNFGARGLQSYLRSHRHNELCRRLGLTPPEARSAETPGMIGAGLHAVCGALLPALPRGPQAMVPFHAALALGGFGAQAMGFQQNRKAPQGRVLRGGLLDGLAI